VSGAIVQDGGGVVTGVGEAGTWDELLTEIDGHDGWVLDFPDSRERNLAQATILGDILTFTSYIPSLDPADLAGASQLYALYYRTGTAYTQSVIGLDQAIEVRRRIPLGRGLAQSPNLHTGREAGSKVFLQTSTGAIRILEEANPGLTKSRRLSWEEEE